MATLDLSNATVTVNMTDPDLVDYGSRGGNSPTLWSYSTSGGHHHVIVSGQGMAMMATTARYRAPRPRSRSTS